MQKLFVLFVAAFLSCALPLAAELQEAAPGRIVSVIDGDTVILKDGREVRLVGIQAPKLPLGRPNFSTWPLAGDAKAYLEGIGQGRDVEVAFGGARMDRHGRVLAHLYADGGTWIQGEMLRAGLARVYSFVDNRSLVADMLALEKEARAAGRGIWSHPFYQIRDAAALAAGPRDGMEGFQLVEGRVLAVGDTRARSFLNFGENWNSDFTVVIDKRTRRLFAEEDLAPEDYEGLRVRVRGWVRFFNGPTIEVTHPEQIELLR